MNSHEPLSQTEKSRFSRLQMNALIVENRPGVQYAERERMIYGGGRKIEE